MKAGVYNKSYKKHKFDKQISNLQNIIHKTILSSQKYKIYDILSINELNVCISTLENIYTEISNLLELIKNEEKNITETEILNMIVAIESELIIILKNFGTDSIVDLITLIINKEYFAEQIDNTDLVDKFNIIDRCTHPINFKCIPWKNDINESNRKILQKNRIIEDYMIAECSENLDCFDLARSSKSFQTKVYGIKIAVHDYKNRKTYIIGCIVDDVLLSCLNSEFLNFRLLSLNNDKPTDEEYIIEYWDKFVESLTLKELLVYNNSEIYSKFQATMNQLGLIQQKTISQVVKEFINSELYGQRTTLIQLLIKSNQNEFQYLAYLLYDILSNENNGNIDTLEQTLLYDSLPWNIKKKFRNAMKQTIQYTNNLYNFDNNKIPLEQQICLIKANDSVKEKAILKLKEIKAKSEDSGTKARQYLDGLLKVPFNIVKEEQILTIINDIQNLFTNMYSKICKNNVYENIVNIIEKERYTNIEILDYITNIENKYINKIITDSLDLLITNINSLKKDNIISIHNHINHLIKKNNLNYKKLIYSGKRINVLQKNITDFIKFNKINHMIISSIYNNFSSIISCTNYVEYIVEIIDDINLIKKNIDHVTNYMKDVNKTLNDAIYGHDKAKRQIERIIGQWINGEKSGYCFGFEGPPGIGKCLIKNTQIMLSNGEIKMVQNITLEDKLMGDDGTHRNVIALGTGREKMYKIEQMKGDDYTVNESHILSLKMTKAGKKGDNHQTILGRRYYKNDIVDICIKDYLSLPKYLQECLKGYKVGIDFVEKEFDLEPYALGYWLGGGDTPLPPHNYLKNHNLINNKHIPEIYKCNSRNNRLNLLAGLIDSNAGYYYKTKNLLEIRQNNSILAEDILFLVRSLGFCGKKNYNNGGMGVSPYRIIISGSGREEIPTLLERKRPRAHKQIKDGLNTGIKIIPQEEDQYYGFQIDGNSRFLLGDFTVTHNTSLAKKGIANCLKDYQGDIRPFAFIAVGGSANGSTLEGHNYTYVGSTWGRIVDILIETKCMNPIIFIDELDKISRTEHGREIIGILTHLIDPTQNDSFQDKYFSGIDLDLSKALFIFSYNDVEFIDRILLDRIHRIKFKHLSLEEKLVITNKYILPEIYKKMGFENIINISDKIIEYIIYTYTNEPGVRKLKEILFEIIGEINLTLLTSKDNEYSFPIDITVDDLRYKYLKDRHEHKIKKINCKHSIGVVNGLWANSVGQGGLLPIETRFFPAASFLDLKLTGMQGDVMKESMNVAKTLAWSLLDEKIQKDHLETFEKHKNHGIHIHVPEGATPKDGPSGGAAITTVIYSLLSSKEINKDFAMTGEICLQGKITAIGGLDLKILGGIESGATKFIYPKENDKDYKEFYDNLQNKDILDDITFYPVEYISEVFEKIFI